MSAPTLQSVQALYKSTLSAASKFASYNYRSHFTRRAHETFKPVISTLESNNTSKDLSHWIKEKEDELEVLKRAGTVNSLFEGPKLVVEHPRVITGGGGAGAEASMAGTEKLEQGN